MAAWISPWQISDEPTFWPRERWQYQWAEDYFRDPDAKEDQEQEEKFVPKPYIGKTTGNTGKKKKAEKKPTEKKKPEPKPTPEKKPSTDGQMSLLDFSVAKAG